MMIKLHGLLTTPRISQGGAEVAYDRLPHGYRYRAVHDVETVCHAASPRDGVA